MIFNVMTGKRPVFLVIWYISILLVCYCSLTPRLELPVTFWNADKVYHLLAYGWIANLPFLGYSVKKQALLASFSMIFLGIVLEIGQIYVPGRTFSFIDIIANSLGVFLGMLMGRRIHRGIGL